VAAPPIKAVGMWLCLGLCLWLCLWLLGVL